MKEMLAGVTFCTPDITFECEVTLRSRWHGVMEYNLAQHDGPSDAYLDNNGPLISATSVRRRETVHFGRVK